jgi:hypothetical protein
VDGPCNAAPPAQCLQALLRVPEVDALMGAATYHRPLYLDDAGLQTRYTGSCPVILTRLAGDGGDGRH